MRDQELAESEARSHPESRLAEGARYDRNKAPGLEDREKSSTEKVNVEGGGASISMYDLDSSALPDSQNFWSEADMGVL